MHTVKAPKATLKSRKAFTLLELIAVIIIIGVLAAIAVVGFRTVIDNSRDGAVEASAQQVDREIRAAMATTYSAATGEYSLPDVGDLSSGNGVAPGTGGASYCVANQGRHVTLTYTNTAENPLDPSAPATFSEVTQGACPS